MNKIKHVFLLLLVSLTMSSFAVAQKAFEGKIVYAIKVMGENADQMAAFMPESYEYLIKGSSIVFRMNGGMTAAMMGDMLIDGKKGETFMVKHSEKVAYKMPATEDEEDATATKPSIKKLDEVITILGHKCQKYEVKVTDDEGVEATQYMWCTDGIAVERPSDSKSMGGGNIFMEGISGFPLKIMTETMGMTMVMTVTEISPKTLSDSEFSFPSSYEVKDFDLGMFGVGR